MSDRRRVWDKQTQTALVLGERVAVAHVEIDFTVDFTVEDRTALSAITVCCVCGRPINPETQAEHDASESLGVHVGNCFHALKRECARMGARTLMFDEHEPIDEATCAALSRVRS